MKKKEVGGGQLGLSISLSLSLYIWSWSCSELRCTWLSRPSIN